MPKTKDLTAAGRLLLDTIGTGSPFRTKKALRVVEEIFAKLFAMAPAALAKLLPSHAHTSREPPGHVDAQLTLRLLPLLESDLPLAFHLLRRTLQPSAITGLEEIFNFAPAFADVEKPLFAALDSGQIDFDGTAAILIGRYGPAAISALPKLLRRLKNRRSDCSVAAGLTWAVFMIGGLRPVVRQLLFKVATEKDSCPHAREVARTIFRTNRISLRTGRFYGE